MKALESGYSKLQTIKIMADTETAMGVGIVSHYFNYLSINPHILLIVQQEVPRDVHPIVLITAYII